jgi:hypothetical protein
VAARIIAANRDIGAANKTYAGARLKDEPETKSLRDLALRGSSVPLVIFPAGLCSLRGEC